MDVIPDGTGVETAGWFRSNRDGTARDSKNSDDSIVMSRLCALDWVIVLYESVVPDALKADVSFLKTFTKERSSKIMSIHKNRFGSHLQFSIRNISMQGNLFLLLFINLRIIPHKL